MRLPRFLRRWLSISDAPLVGTPKEAKKQIALHELFPEVLHWHVGDEIAVGGYTYKFISCTIEGVFYLEHFGHLERFSLSRIRTETTNVSLRDREISAELKQSNEYMELLAQFQESVKELQRRDIERYGSPQ